MSKLDTYVRCQHCGNEQKVSFVDSLRHGWLKCCGSEMSVTTSTTTIEAAMDEILTPVSRIRSQVDGLFSSLDRFNEKASQLTSIEVPAIAKNLFTPIQPPQIHTREIEKRDRYE